MGHSSDRELRSPARRRLDAGQVSLWQTILIGTDAPADAGMVTCQGDSMILAHPGHGDRRHEHHMLSTARFLGTETGGTRTDAVLWSVVRGSVAKAKSLTTRHDLSERIVAAIDAVLRQAFIEPGETKPVLSGIACLRPQVPTLGFSVQAGTVYTASPANLFSTTWVPIGNGSQDRIDEDE